MFIKLGERNLFKIKQNNKNKTELKTNTISISYSP
jgi:hypothetical protein